MTDWLSPTAATRLHLQSASAMARETARQSVRFRRDEVAEFLALGMYCISKGRSARISTDFLCDFAKSLHDKVSDAVGGMRRELDEAGVDPDGADIDLGELESLMEGMV